MGVLTLKHHLNNTGFRAPLPTDPFVFFGNSQLAYVCSFSRQWKNTYFESRMEVLVKENAISIFHVKFSM